MSPLIAPRWRRMLLATCLLTALATGRCAQWSGEDPQAYGPIWATILAYVAGVVDLTPITVSEGGSGASFVLVLNKAPIGSVDIEATYSNQITVNTQVSPIQTSFDDSNWNIPQTLLINAVDDADAEGVHEARIDFAITTTDSSFANFAIEPLRIRIIDNDSGGIVVNQTAASTIISESGVSDSYSVVLTFPPAANVDVTATPDAQVRVNGSAAPIILSFDPGNWNVSQNVTVTAINDTVSEGAHTGTITHTATSADPSYNGIAVANVIAQISDNDTPGVTLNTGASVDVTEAGGNDSYTIVLDSQPAANVVVTVTPDAQLGCGGCSAAFNTVNWNVPQAITVSAVNDSVDEAAVHMGTLTHTVTSVDPDYNGLAVPNVTVNISDNDAAGVTITESGGTTAVSEAGPTNDTYTIVLATQPTMPVNITPTACGGGQVTLAPAPPLVFNNVNWNVPQTVTVTAVNDSVAEGAHNCVITHAAASADANYNAIPVGSVTAAITDNDVPGVTINESGGSTQVNEEGPTSDTYTVRLNTQPTNNVTITINCGVEATCAPSPLTFTMGACPGPGNWCANQTVTVTAVDDGDVEPPPPHAGVASHTAVSADPNYNGIVIADVNYTVIDNDSAGITVTPTPPGPMAVTEGGATAALSIVLNSPPSANVDITINADADTQVNGAASHVLTFTGADWFTVQNVTISAVNDALQEGTETTPVLTFTVASGDAAYNALAIADMNVTVTDNDVKRIFVSTGAWNGDLSNVAGADALCNADAGGPAAPVFRAMIVDGLTRVASVTPDAGDGQVSWVLQPNMRYFRTNAGGAFITEVFTTNANALPLFPWTAGGGVAANVWTGLNADWTSATALTQNCFFWTDGSGSWNGAIGVGNATISTAIRTGVSLCSNTLRLYCVEQ